MSRVPDEHEWRNLSTLCQKQAISGIVFHALDGLRTYAQKPPLTVLYEWIGYANQIEERNRLTTDVCKELCDELDKDGIRTCIPGKTCLVPYEKEFSFLDELSK